jgi:hypothetical protein
MWAARPSTASARTGWNAASHGSSPRRPGSEICSVVTAASTNPMPRARDREQEHDDRERVQGVADGLVGGEALRPEDAEAGEEELHDAEGDDQVAQGGVGDAQSLAHGRSH